MSRAPIERARRPVTSRDALILTLLLLLALMSVPHDLARASTPGPFARVAMSWEMVNRGAFTEGTLPLWNPYQFGGRPHLANPETLSVYPPHVLLRLLPLPLFFPLGFAMHTWLAGAGIYLAARTLGAPRLASALASGALVGGRLVVPIEEQAYSVEVYALAWLPLIAAYALRSAESPRWLPHPGLVLVTTLGLLASALNPTYVAATVIGCYTFSAFWLSPRGARTRHLAQPLILASLAAGIAAVQIVPTVRFRTTTGGSRQLSTDGPLPLQNEAGSTTPRPGLITALRPLAGRGRALSVCSRAIDGSDFVALHVPGVSGSGGVFLADYARFSHLVRGPTERMRPVFEGIPEAAHGAARADLLRLLGVEYLVACDPVNAQRWALISAHEGVGIYRSLVPAPRAFWTCAPGAVGRDELEYRLRHNSYDVNLVLRPHLIINVRWPAGISGADRARAESTLRLAPHRDIADRTWEYNLTDRSSENIAAIVRHPLVEDTQGIDRVSMRPAVSPSSVPAFDEPKSEWLIGVDECGPPVPVMVRRQDRFDGGMIVDVNAPRDGLVFFSETYYRDRRAWVDGRRVARLKVNLAFTGVPVSGGSHRIELKYDARSFWWGAGLSALTAMIWLAAAAANPRSVRGVRL